MGHLETMSHSTHVGMTAVQAQAKTTEVMEGCWFCLAEDMPADQRDLGVARSTHGSSSEVTETLVLQGQFMEAVLRSKVEDTGLKW